MNSNTKLIKVVPSSEGMKIIRGYERINEDYPDYIRDESNIGTGRAEALFFPKNVQNIAWVIEEAKREKKNVTISGGRTGICGGAVPENGWIVSLDRMKRILDVSCEHKNGKRLIPFITLEPGVRLNEIAQYLKENDFAISNSCVDLIKKSKSRFFYPPDPTETTATIGGTASTNASGARTLRYGPTRNFIYGLEVLLTNGYLLKIKRGEVISKDGFFYLQGNGTKMKIPAPRYKIPKTKHSAGIFSSEPMDLIDLFIGSEGVLGVITSVTIKVIEEPKYIVSGMAFFDEEDKAVSFVEDSRGSVKDVTCLEYFDKDAIRLLQRLREEQGPVSEIPDLPVVVVGVYFESFADDLKFVKKYLYEWKEKIEKYSGLIDISLASIEPKDINRFKIIRHSVPEMINRRISEIKKLVPEVHKVGTDMAVPDGYLRPMLSYYREKLNTTGIEYVVFGHIGNNHLHVNMIPKDREELNLAEELYSRFAKKAVEFGGSISGEHGIGKLKKKYLRIQFTENEIEEMKTIKNLFDPDNILNPGDLFE